MPNRIEIDDSTIWVRVRKYDARRFYEGSDPYIERYHSTRVYSIDRIPVGVVVAINQRKKFANSIMEVVSPILPLTRGRVRGEG